MTSYWLSWDHLFSIALKHLGLTMSTRHDRLLTIVRSSICYCVETSRINDVDSSWPPIDYRESDMHGAFLDLRWHVLLWELVGMVYFFVWFPSVFLCVLCFGMWLSVHSCVCTMCMHTPQHAQAVGRTDHFSSESCGLKARRWTRPSYNLISWSVGDCVSNSVSFAPRTSMPRRRPH